MNGQEQGGMEFNPAQFFDSLYRVGRELLLRPRLFYRQVPTTAPVRGPLAFLCTMSFLAALCIANYRAAGFQVFVVLMASNVCAAAAASLLLHGIAVKLCRSGAGIGATFRIIAYASIVDVLSWIPTIGLVPYCYGLYLIFIGLQELHRMSARQAALALTAIIAAITLVFGSLLVLAPESVQEGIKLLDPQRS